MDDSLELSDSDFLDVPDADFLKWAGAHPQRWALLPGERREAWLDHLIARMKMTVDADQRNEYWRIAYVIASADDATLQRDIS